MQLRTGPWPARATWALLPLAMGSALGTALDEHTRAVSVTGAVLAWGVWVAVLVAVIVPRAVSLTALRTAAPAALAVANWSALAGDRSGADLLAVAWAAITLVAAFSPDTGDIFVNGSSYGDERRMPLRVPGALLLGPLQLTWVGAVAAPIGVPLLLAAKGWIAAGLLAVAGGPAAYVALRALHGLSRRWVVFVPAGVVLHDLHALVDPVLFPRRTIRRLGPAPADVDDVLDLTQRALGLALELELTEEMDIAPRRSDGEVEVVKVRQLLFAPSRPGAVVAEASRRRIAVG